MLAEGIVTKTIPTSILDTFEIPEGSRVQIARIIRTPIGLRFRVINSTRWLGEDELNCQFDPKHIVDYVKIAEQSKNKMIPDNGEKQILKGCKPRKDCAKPVHVSTWRHGNQGRTKAMDKKDLKEAIAGLTTGDRVSVTFLSTMPTGAANIRYDSIREFAGQTVEFTLVETKKGRGKGGSQLMVLKTADDKKVTTGTPHSDVLLNITTPTGKVGHDSEADVPKSFETNAGQASALKNSFKDLVGMQGATVRIESSEPEYTGTFTVTDAEQLRGRHGQVRLSLTAEDGRQTQVWSYRHSGVISKFEVLSNGTAGAETETMEEETMEKTKTGGA